MTTDVENYEPRTEVAEPDPTGGRLIAWAHAAHAAKQLADALCQTTFVPQHFRNKPDDGAAAIMYGDEIGFTPGQALQNVYVITGKPSLYARAMVALVLSKGHEVWTEASSPQRVIVCGKRRGSQHVERVEWTRAKAEQAGYTKNSKYTSDPESMLYARASGDIARRIAPDALAGIAYTVEELELSEDTANGTTTTVTHEKPKRTAQRASAKKVAAEEPDLDEPTEEPKPEAPDGITKPQLTKLAILTKELELDGDREAYLAYLERVIGHPVDSSKQLTKDEASDVIDTLETDKTNLAKAAQPDENPGFEGQP